MTDMVIPVHPDNVVDLWESVSPAYPKSYDKKLAVGINKILKKYEKKSGSVFKRILDAGCGTGNPAIGLRKEFNYDIYCTDISQNMIEKLKINLKNENCKIDFMACEWRDLNKYFKKPNEKFDAVICRGNSLIYVTSWGRNALVQNVAIDGVKEAIKNFYDILNPGGILYVDLTSQKEYKSVNHFEYIGNRHPLKSKQEFILFWKAVHDYKYKTRYVHAYRLFLSDKSSNPEIMKSYKFTSLLLMQDELVEYLHEVGFYVEDSDISVPVEGETLYDVVIGRKPC